MTLSTPWKFGCHDQDGGPAAKEWARYCNVVKACGNPAVLHEAPDHALRIWRWPFGQVESTRLLDQMAVEETVGRMISPLDGYNHPNLFLEGLNEVPRQLFFKLVQFMILLKAELESRGYNLTGPASATGDFEKEDIALLRTVKLKLWTFHGYMTREKGPTEWNAYRMRRLWLPGDPGVVYSESTYDRCRDGDVSINQGYLPLGDGPFGWEYQFKDDPDPVGNAARGIISYARGLTEPWELGSTGFTTTPKEEWRQKGFGLDPLIPYFIREYSPWRPIMPGSNDWCPFAERDELPDGLWDSPRDNNTKPYLICEHIAAGNGDPGPFWVTLLQLPPSKRASAHFWVSKSGKLKQYVPISGQAWSNGPLCRPDVGNILIRNLVAAGLNPNAATVSIENQGYPGEIFTVQQIDTNKKLHQWLHGTHGMVIDRAHCVGHYQFDNCDRPNCPGPTYPWGAILGGTPPMADTPDQLRNETYDLAHKLRALKPRWEAIGYPQHGAAVDYGGGITERLISISKGEK